ncbi:MAG: hypothetical protein A2018_00475 [Alphaproteobacteria bacterium GWF2_58_20]|nr:MAG: hypothetical protein A2018_00475 [Alphaproteobacteria bacterium GWF2_58_20]
MKKLVLACLFLLAAMFPAQAAMPDPDNSTWFTQGASPQDAKVKLYFFWSQTCPHCHEAKPFLDGLAKEWPWLDIQSYEISRNRQNAGMYEMMARMLGEEAQYVPAFFYCGKSERGYDKAETSGSLLRSKLEGCHAALLHAQARTTPSSPETVVVQDAGKAVVAEPVIRAVADDKVAAPAVTLAKPETRPAPETGFPKAPSRESFAQPQPARPEQAAKETFRIPFVGDMSADDLSLPMLTVMLAGMDAFNPCAFFVLLFLLSVMVRAQSRWRMGLVGGVFVFISGLVYFLFMSVWLTAFGIIARLNIFAVVTTIAGIVAVLIGGMGVKEFYFFRKGPSLSIPDSAKPKLFERMNALVSADSLVTMLVGTVTLAAVANSYELLCTAGFPMVYTNALTGAGLSTFTRYMYLVAYNVIYVVPLAVIVGVFTATMGARKLKESEGRTLKLLSGVMMMGLGIVLIVKPALLSSVSAASLLIAGAIILVAVLVVLDRRRVHG